MASGAAMAACLILLIMGSSMKDQSSTENKGPSGLDEEQFWEQPLMQKSASLFGFKLLTDGKDGIFIDAPAKVFLDKHETAPLIGFRVGDTEKLRKFSFQTTTRLILSHLETGRIQVVKADVAPPPGQEKPSASPGSVVIDVEADLIQFMGQEKKVGRFSVVMICGPEKSNQRIVTLYPSKKSEGSTELQQQLTNLRESGGAPLPVLLGKTLELKHEVGPEFDGTAWKLSAVKDPARDRIRLDYRLEVPPRLVNAADKPQVDENGKRIHAILPVTLIGFDENRSVVLHKSLGLPVAHPPAGEVGKPVLQGSVSLSLGKLMGTRAIPQPLYLWALTLDQSALAELTLGAPGKSP